MYTACESWLDYWRQDSFWRDSQLWRINAELFFRRAAPVVGFGKDDTVLSIGCGPGHLEGLLAPAVKSISALDVAEQFVSMCRERCRGLGNVEVGFLRGDYTDLSAYGGPFSLILAVSVVQYYREKREMEALIDSAGRVAAPGGRMLIADLPRERGAVGFAWDVLCSCLQGLREGYGRVLLRAAVATWLRQSRYRSFRSKTKELCFTVSELDSLIQRRGLDAVVVRRSLSIYANRPSLLIRF